MSVFGHVHVGLWMKSPEEAETMLRALEAGLRQTAANDPDRAQLEEWRRQALNMRNKAKTGEWPGWQA